MPKEYMDLKPYLPRFSLRERDRRWAAVRMLMGLQDLDCLLLVGNDRFFGYGNSNVRYLTQIDGQRMGVAAIFPFEGDPLVFASPPHMHDTPFPVYKAFNDWISETRPMAGLKPVVESMKTMGFETGNIGLVSFKVGPSSAKSGIFSYQEYLFLLEALPKAHFLDATSLLDQVRMIKSEEEIEMLRRSGEISRQKIEVMVDMSRPGVKECELYAEMVKMEISLGAEAFIFNLLASGSVTDPNRVQHLLHGRGQCLSPTTRPLAKGDLIMTEFHTSYGGYLTGCEKSVFVGKPPKELQRIHDVAVECLQMGVEKLRPGATIGEVAEAFRKPVKKANMEYIELGFHGHGLSSPEYPSMAVKTGRPEHTGVGCLEIKENMVFATNIDIHDPAWRNDVGIMGPGETVWVSKKGPVKLIGTPASFSIG